MWLKHSKVTDVACIHALNFSIAQSLAQIMDFPTRFPSKSQQQASLLVLFFTTFLCSCQALQHCPLGNSDHSVVAIDISFQASIKQEPLSVTSMLTGTCSRIFFVMPLGLISSSSQLKTVPLRFLLGSMLA